ncbi:hypothetical protein IJ103_03645, partial [Candidatus Saccharibacteria bacterium]|nr:hypothetical protein [Candidatus Saccharibacteria bacterium]
MNSSALTDTYNLTVTDNPSLTVTLNPGTPISLNPTAEGVFGSQDVGVNVMTTDDKGYTLTMSAATSSLSRSTADSSAPVIETLASATAQNDFPNNRWGFKRTSTKYTDTNFQPMLANYNVPVSSNGNITGSSGETSTLTFGVKLNTDIPSGEYSIAINFLAVNNVAPNLYYMQDATPSSLAAAMPNVHDTAVLYDRRDGQEYTVAKLKDGKYWMTKNLTLAGGIVLTSEDTDMAPGYTLPVANGFQEGNRLPEASKYGTGFTEQEMAAVYNSGNEEYTTGGLLSYYNWTATTLGSGVGIYEDNIDAPYSICPAGWKLPTSRTGEFTEEKALQSDTYQMAVQYGLSENEWLSQTGSQFCSQAGTCASTVPNIGMNGYYWNGELVNDGYAQYATATTSATPNDGANVRTLGYGYRGYSSPLRVWSSQSISRGLGFSVRCLFDDTMQSFSSDYASALAMEESVQLRDKRDNKYYWVTKLKDGNVWMTQNLDLDLDSSVALTSADTDLHSVTSWTPVRSTIDSTTYNNTASGASGGIVTYNGSNSQNGGFASDWTNDYNTPYSVDPGYRYVVPKEMSGPNTNYYDNGDTFYYCTNQDATCGGNSENGHYTMGNFYNFAA